MTAALTTLRRRIDARTIDELECVASVLLAILVAHWLGATNVSWAAFSGYMVMRGHVGETVQRGALRIVGTLAGGLLALAAIPLIAPHWPLAALGILVIGTATLYKAITAKRAYAWLFVGLTFAMVLFDKLHDPGIPLAAFVQTRILETSAGTSNHADTMTSSASAMPPCVAWRAAGRFHPSMPVAALRTAGQTRRSVTAESRLTMTQDAVPAAVSSIRVCTKRTSGISGSCSASYSTIAKVRPTNSHA